MHQSDKDGKGHYEQKQQVQAETSHSGMHEVKLNCAGKSVTLCVCGTWHAPPAVSSWRGLPAPPLLLGLEHGQDMF